MNSRLVALKLFLDQLGQSHDISDMNQRLRIQKIVYLGQLFDIDLGYRYSWYIKGPYSPSLTQDYYALEDAYSVGDRSYETRAFSQSIKSSLKKAKKLLQKPDKVDLDEVRWYELLASLDYLKRISKYDNNRATETIQKYKPYLTPYIANALKHLKEFAPAIK